MTIKLMLPGFMAARAMLLPGEATALEAQFRELPPAPYFSPAKRHRIEEVDASSQAANTKRNYLRASKGFTDWCDEQGCSSLPAHPEAVKYYLAERYDSGMKIGTVRLDAASIGDDHRPEGAGARPARDRVAE